MVTHDYEINLNSLTITNLCHDRFVIDNAEPVVGSEQPGQMSGAQLFVVTKLVSKSIKTEKLGENRSISWFCTYICICTQA